MTVNKNLREAIISGISIPDNVRKSIRDLNENLRNGPGFGSFSDETENTVKNWFNELPQYYFVSWVPEITTEECDDGTAYPSISRETIASVLLEEYAQYI